MMSESTFPAVSLIIPPVLPPVLAQIHMEAPPDSSSLANLLVEKLDGGAVLVDVRPPDSSEAIDGVFRDAKYFPLESNATDITSLV